MERTDEFYLSCTLNLAKLGEAKAFPNPIVGALIVSDGLVIGEGFHREYGKAHAEPNAVSNLKRNILSFLDKGAKTEDYFTVNPKFTYLAKEDELNIFFKKALEQCNKSESQDIEDILNKLILSICRKATIYVSLEPCNHYGKTAPCTKLIKDLGFKRLVYAYKDPNPIIRNNSENLLHDSDIEILYLNDADLRKRFEFDNRIFLHLMKRPEDHLHTHYLSLKVAAYPDGSMETKKDEKWISNSFSRKDVQRLRACNEILVTGINTIKRDNPSLNVRLSPEEMNLSDITRREIFILKSSQDFSEAERKNLKIFKTNAEQEIVEIFIESSLVSIFPTSSKRLMIEAGPRLVSSFLSNTKLVNEIIHYEPFMENESMSLEIISEKKERIMQYYLNINPRLNLQIIKEEIMHSEGERSDLKLIIRVI